MRSCPRCGAPNPDEHKFCASCGLKLAPVPAPADEITPAWLNADDTAQPPALLDDSWLNPAARRQTAVATDTPDWLRRDEIEASAAPDAAGSPAPVEQRPDQLPDWLREVADESRQRLDARAQEAQPAPEQAQPVVQTSLANSDELPDWLREITADAHAADATAQVSASDAEINTAAPTSTANDTPSWLRDQPPAAQATSPADPGEPDQSEVVDAEVVAVQVHSSTDEAGVHNSAAVAGTESSWLDDGTALATTGPADDAEEMHARVYDVPESTIWTAQPDRPAPDGSTGMQTALWAAPDETARSIVPQAAAFQLPSWLEDDDIEAAPVPPARAWSPPSWLEDADVDGQPRQPSSWAPPNWLDNDDEAPPPRLNNRMPSWLGDDEGGVAVAPAPVARAAATQAAPRPAEGQSAQLLQNLLAESTPEPEPAANAARGSGTMLVVLVVVLLVMLAVIGFFALPALGVNLF